MKLLVLFSWTSTSLKDLIDERGCGHESPGFAHEAASDAAVFKHTSVDVDRHEAESIDEHLHQSEMPIIIS